MATAISSPEPPRKRFGQLPVIDALCVVLASFSATVRRLDRGRRPIHRPAIHVIRSVLGAIVLLVALSNRAQAEEAAPSEVALPAVIDDVRIEMKSVLWHTRPKVVLRELPWKSGGVVTQDAWDLGLARLWNTELFSQIDAKVIL